MGDLIACAACGNSVSAAAAACPRCGHPVSQNAEPPKARTQRFGLFVFGACVVFGVAAVWTALSLRSSTTATAAVAPVETAATPAPAEQPVDTTKATLIRMDHLAWPDAFASVRSSMSDSNDDDSRGTALFALWAARRMRWNDVSVDADETTFGLVQRDSQEQIGKRMCSSGQIVEIHADSITTGGKLAHGLLMSDAGHLYRFMAAGSCGDVVTGSYARHCGVVTGNYDYSNSGGGTGHAVAVVGMFDLPQNKISR
jgi:hypothetical protein